LRDALFDELEINPNNYWHRPIVVRDTKKKLGDIIGQMKVVPEHPDDDVIDNDLILVWGEQRRIITGADLLGRLLRGIVAVDGKGDAPHTNRGANSGAATTGQGTPSMWSSR
jgi:metal transporter CNNM